MGHTYRVVHDSTLWLINSFITQIKVSWQGIKLSMRLIQNCGLKNRVKLRVKLAKIGVKVRVTNAKIGVNLRVELLKKGVKRGAHTQ